MSLQIQNLTSQFNVLLSDYKDISKKYTDLINEHDDTLTQIPDSAFIGESNVNILGESNVTACQSACSANKSCSGATFDSTLKNCTLFSGQGNIVPTEKSVAIVQQVMFYSNRLKELNQEMTSLNQQIITLSNENQNQYSKNASQTQQQEVIMVNNNEILIKDRKQIDMIMNQFQSLNTAYEDGNTIVTNNYMKYIIFLFVVIILILLLLRTAVSSPQSGGGNKSGDKSNILLIVFGIFIVFTIVTYLQNN
jgi:hypothetical protein